MNRSESHADILRANLKVISTYKSWRKWEDTAKKKKKVKQNGTDLSQLDQDKVPDAGCCR